MLTTIKGYYDHGQIILDEQAPVEFKTEVIVTFLSDYKTGKKKHKRILGALEGKFKIAEDFDAPLDDLKDYM